MNRSYVLVTEQTNSALDSSIVHKFQVNLNAMASVDKHSRRSSLGELNKTYEMIGLDHE